MVGAEGGIVAGDVGTVIGVDDGLEPLTVVLTTVIWYAVPGSTDSMLPLDAVPVTVVVMTELDGSVGVAVIVDDVIAAGFTLFWVQEILN